MDLYKRSLFFYKSICKQISYQQSVYQIRFVSGAANQLNITK